MMIIRHLQYLCALARERHFARAAAVCNVTQSTLSAGIKQLEESLGVRIVERGQRFIGLTEEGERVLAWAQRVLVDYGGLQQELSEMREGMVGQLRIGAIPVTLPSIPLLTSPFAQSHLVGGREPAAVSLGSLVEPGAPHFLLLGETAGLTAIPLVEPEASHLIGLVASDRDPFAPVARALLDLAQRLDIGKAIDRNIGQPATAGLV